MGALLQGRIADINVRFRWKRILCRRAKVFQACIAVRAVDEGRNRGTCEYREHFKSAGLHVKETVAFLFYVILYRYHLGATGVPLFRVLSLR